MQIYFECDVCHKEFLDEDATTEATAENKRIEPLGEEDVNVSVTTKYSDGAAVADTGLKLKLVLKNAAFEKTYDDIAVSEGKLELSKIGAGEYTAIVTNNNAYYETPFTVTKGESSANLALVKTKHTVTQCDTVSVKDDTNNGETFVFTTPWQDGITAPSVSLMNPDAITGKNYFASAAFGTVNVTVDADNKVTLQNVYAGKYILQVEGYIYTYDVDIAETCAVEVTVESNAYTYGNPADLSVVQHLGGWAEDRDCNISNSDVTKIAASTLATTQKEIYSICNNVWILIYCTRY